MTEYTYKVGVPPIAEAWALFCTADYSGSFRLTEDEFGRSLRGSWRVAAAYDGDKLVGMGRLNSDGVVYAVLHDLITDPEYKQQGVATEILDILEAECREAHVRKVQLFSNDGLEEFYKKRGYCLRNPDAPGMEKTL